MTTLLTTAITVASYALGADTGEAEAAAAGFLARYGGRTLEAYRHDLKTSFQWAADRDLVVLDATRAHIELYRMALEDRGLAPATVDRRLTTVCGFYRFAHIGGRIRSNPAQHVRRPRVHPSEGRGMDRAELGRFLFTAETVTPAHAVLLGLNGLRVSEACSANIEDLGFERGHRTLEIMGKDTKPGSMCGCVGGSPASLAMDCTQRAVRGTNGMVAEQRSSWPPSMPVYLSERSNQQPVTPTRGPRPSMTGDARTSTATPSTSSSPAANNAMSHTRRSGMPNDDRCGVCQGASARVGMTSWAMRSKASSWDWSLG